MHYPMVVDVTQSLADAECDLDGPLRRKFFFFGQYLAEQLPFGPFHHHVVLTAVIVGNHLHDARMIEMFADFLLALKTRGEDLVIDHLGVGKLDGYVPPVRMSVAR